MIPRCAKVLLHTCLAFKLLLLIIATLFFTGCGTTKTKTGTDQLLMSNAVDLTVGDLDFSTVAGEKVFLDTQFINVKGYGFVNSQYIVSSLRQQLIAHGCELLDAKGEADYVIEARVGALGTDSQTITYGIPGNNTLGNMASLIPNAPAVPVIPEISIAKRDDNAGIAKISVFIYETKTKMPIWQSGVEYARSTSNDMWIFGAGPLQWGTVHGQTKFAGTPLNVENFNVQNSMFKITKKIYEDITGDEIIMNPVEPKKENYQKFFNILKSNKTYKKQLQRIQMYDGMEKSFQMILSATSSGSTCRTLPVPIPLEIA